MENPEILLSSKTPKYVEPLHDKLYVKGEVTKLTDAVHELLLKASEFIQTEPGAVMKLDDETIEVQLEIALRYCPESEDTDEPAPPQPKRNEETFPDMESVNVT
jgi:hypothetical protein